MNFGDIAALQDMENFPGATNGNVAGPGKIGEIQETRIGSVSAVALTSGAAANVASVSLTAGDWDVTGMVTLKYTSATQSADGQAGLSGTSASLPGDSLRGYDNTRQTTTTSNASIALPPYNFPSSGSQTVYLAAQASFSAGTCAAFGRITARRVR